MISRNRIDRATPVILVLAMGFFLLGRRGITGEPFNVRLVGSISITAGGLRVDDANLYVGVTGGFLIWDVSSPVSPVPFSHFYYPSGGGGLPPSSHAIEVRAGLAYTADGVYGLHIVDVTNPASPLLCGTYQTPSDALDVCLSGPLAFIADYNSVQIIDVSNPSAPTFRGSYPLTYYEVVDVSAWGSLLCATNGRLHVLDVTNPSSPVLRSSWGSPGPYPIGIWSVCVSNGIAYVTDTTGTVTAPYDRLLAIDVRNPSDPRLLTSTPLAPGSGGPVFVSSHYVYASLHGGLYIYDITNPAVLPYSGYYPWWGNIYVRPDPFYGNLVYVGFNRGVYILQFPAGPTAADRRWNLYR